MSIYYFYINFKSLFVKNRKKKLINKEQIKVFLRYINKTSIFVKILVSNLSKIIKYNIVKYIENKKKEYINFKKYIKIINILLKRQLINRSYKDII